jgi:hypothetical protein
VASVVAGEWVVDSAADREAALEVAAVAGNRVREDFYWRFMEALFGVPALAGLESRRIERLKAELQTLFRSVSTRRILAASIPPASNLSFTSSSSLLHIAVQRLLTRGPQ